MDSADRTVKDKTTTQRQNPLWTDIRVNIHVRKPPMNHSNVLSK